MRHQLFLDAKGRKAYYLDETHLCVYLNDSAILCLTPTQGRLVLYFKYENDWYLNERDGQLLVGPNSFLIQNFISVMDTADYSYIDDLIAFCRKIMNGKTITTWDVPSSYSSLVISFCEELGLWHSAFLHELASKSNCFSWK